MFDRSGGGTGIIRELISWVFEESISDTGVVGSFVELAKISRAEGRVVSERPGTVFLAASCRRVKNEGSSSSELCAELFGVITLQASREKNRTLWPVPGVFFSRRIERRELYRPTFSSAVWGVEGSPSWEE